jgi:hypothetical protein
MKMLGQYQVSWCVLLLCVEDGLVFVQEEDLFAFARKKTRGTMPMRL